jgi:enamine deaminase RidA (YjgF/YER057c/UK114 family)
MPRQIITTANAPSSPLYCQAVKAGPHVLVSGMAGIDPSTGSLAGETIQDQVRQALENCQAVLQAGGAGLDDVIEVRTLRDSHLPGSPAAGSRNRAKTERKTGWARHRSPTRRSARS